MSFLQGYTAAAASIAAMQATRTRALLAAQHRLLADQHAEARRQAALRQEIFAFADVLRQARASGRYLQAPAHGLYEAQRFADWIVLNGVSTASLPSFEDKASLTATCEEAARVLDAGARALGPGPAGAVRRLAVLEDLAPYAAEYQTWKGVLGHVRRWTPLVFHGCSSVAGYFLLTSGATACVLVGTGLSGMAGRGLVADALGLLTAAVALGMGALAHLGPFLRRVLVAGLDRRVRAHGGRFTTRTTAGRVRGFLDDIRALMARLDPGLAAARPGEILDDCRLAFLRVEHTQLQAALTTAA